ncbi:MAG: PHP domain-containing protein [Lachnospiraceae bacterium]|nr:PHP domain-containing protein [Lachnospiraceae bacterium]MBQ6095874.1 PHP domain-containing protein [Lachnospiraceae bacterium]
MIDLHVHSTRSDGTYTPTELVEYAIEKGLTAFALTDHDTTDGLDEAISYANALRAEGKADVPEVIPGIELSTNIEDTEVHVAGLFIDKENPEFRSYLKEFVASRNLRNVKMCAKLTEIGIPITAEELESAFPNCILTRAHFASWLREHGYVSSNKEAFDRYLGKRCPCYVPREKITPQKAIALILTAGGIPVLAHPILYRLSDARLEALVATLKEAGLVGIEAIYSTYEPSEERQIRRLAKKYDLLLSGGSDFHGTNKPRIDLGVGLGRLYVPDELLENMKAYLAERPGR